MRLQKLREKPLLLEANPGWTVNGYTVDVAAFGHIKNRGPGSAAGKGSFRDRFATGCSTADELFVHRAICDEICDAEIFVDKSVGPGGTWIEREERAGQSGIERRFVLTTRELGSRERQNDYKRSPSYRGHIAPLDSLGRVA